MRGQITDIPAFPGDTIALTIPESIGDADNPIWFDEVSTIQWEELSDDTWRCQAGREHELSYVATVTTTETTVDIEITLTNESDRHWEHSYAFTCCNPRPFTPVTDYECVRHWSRSDGEFKRLTELPREFSPRATIQLYSIEDAPAGTDIGFVEAFEATPDVRLEPWLAIEAVDGDRHLAVTSDPPLFLFQNMEYSCIHSCPTFGSLGPGERGTAVTRIYLTDEDLNGLYSRMCADFDWE